MLADADATRRAHIASIIAALMVANKHRAADDLREEGDWGKPKKNLCMTVCSAARWTDEVFYLTRCTTSVRAPPLDTRAWCFTLILHNSGGGSREAERWAGRSCNDANNAK